MTRDDNPSQHPVVELDNVEIVYNRHFLAVQGVSMEAQKGDIVALMGPNGAGKSTILKMISGIGLTERGEVSRGSVRYKGEDTTNADTNTMVNKGVTHILEGRRTFEDLSVEDNFDNIVSDVENAFDSASVLTMLTWVLTGLRLMLRIWLLRLWAGWRRTSWTMMFS